MTDSETIDDMASVLIDHGHTQDTDDLAAEWAGYGFDADDVESWCEVGCWEPFVAADFREADMTPRVAARACNQYGREHGLEMDAMYAACNLDVSADDIIAAYQDS
jgi:hypothetical protein